MAYLEEDKMEDLEKDKIIFGQGLIMAKADCSGQPKSSVRAIKVCLQRLQERPGIRLSFWNP